MLRRVMIMASPKSRGRALAVGERGGQQMAGFQSKPPTGRVGSGSQSDKSLINGFTRLNLQDARKGPSSSLSGHVTRRPYTANHRPVSIKNIDDVALLLKEELVKNVVIVAGAGISTPSGIPDFRSPGTGLYDNLQQYNIPYAEAIFDIDYFHHNPRPFFTLAKELYPRGKYRPNYLHYFAKLLHDRGLLLRIYTQNIDGLERIAGIPEDKMVEAHGTFSTATCITCRQKYNGEDIKERIFEDKLPRCKRTTCNGIVKPDIVFFGEELPKRFYFYLKDMLKTDLVIIMGTSLEVQPFAGIIDTVRFTVPRLLFNRMAVGPFRKQKRAKDFVSAGDLLEQMQEFVSTVGWTQDMIDLITRREGLFKTAFPPPAPPPSESGQVKAAKPVKPDSLAAMWRQNAALNFYSDSESSDTDSGVTPTDSESSSSDSDRERGRGAGARGGRTKGAGGPGGMTGKSNTRTVSSSSSGCVSNASSTNGGGGGVRGSVSDRRLAKPPGSLLSRRGNGPGSTSGGSLGATPRSFSQHAVARKGPQASTQREPYARRTAWMGREGAKPPPGPHPGHRKPPGGGRGANPPLRLPAAARVSQAPSPGSHAVKPRSHSVTKAVPEKLHSQVSDSRKALCPRIKSADPARIAFRHRAQPAPYDARMLAIHAGLSDSSSSGGPFDHDSSDDSSDDS